ncbi:hypothetical protein GCM10008098_08840 [Rhodanobacter panaciterrae]|uniref:Resolvase/invertase-type recombinase catalytic domain-containing protein n=1 Tax=Rhodanobacter panaciterrae TaxID=490572 RepID=A0ABQ2ZM42_9GAMM|nr:hypothetical protein GCM10008098_08840 [Rhodanobacter panaciterrae]
MRVEAIADAIQRVQVVLIFDTLAKRLSEHGDDAIEHAGCHMAVAPDRIEDFVPAESTARMSREQGEHRKCLRFERHVRAGHE